MLRGWDRLKIVATSKGNNMSAMEKQIAAVNAVYGTRYPYAGFPVTAEPDPVTVEWAQWMKNNDDDSDVALSDVQAGKCLSTSN